MRLGIGNQVVLIVCYVPMSRFMTNGFTSWKTPSPPASSRTGKIGRIGSSSTKEGSCKTPLGYRPRLPVTDLASEALALQRTIHRYCSGNRSGCPNK